MPLVQYPAPPAVTDPCPLCGHAWHGLPCRSGAELNRGVPTCKCLGPWAGEAPTE